MFRMLFTVERSNFHDFSLGIRYIIKTYKVLGVPIYKRFIRWD